MTIQVVISCTVLLQNFFFYKLRTATGNRDDRYTLKGIIEMYQGYFTIEASKSS